MQGIVRTLLLTWVLGIVVVSLAPSGGVSVWNLDKVGHFLAYAGLSTLVCLGFDSLSSRLALSVGAVVLGVLLEFAQQFVPGRDMSTLDGLVNTLGVIAGLLVFRLIGDRLRKVAARWLSHPG